MDSDKCLTIKAGGMSILAGSGHEAVDDQVVNQNPLAIPANLDDFREAMKKM
jgi:hypothetical protein